MKISIFWVYIILATLALGNLATASEDEFPQPAPQEISEEEQPPLPIMDTSGEVQPQPAQDEDEIYID